MALNATVVINNQAGLDANSINLLNLDAQAATATWSSVLAGTANINIEIDILPTAINGSGRGGGTAGYYVYTGDSGAIHNFQTPTAYKLSTGLTPSSVTGPDIKIDLQLSYVQNTLWLDPTPYDNGADIPTNRTDAVSVLVHEMGHAIAFNGFRDWSTGALTSNGQSTFDQHVQVTAGGPVFHGLNVDAVYGKDPALTTGNLYHFGNASPGTGSDLISDLMNGVVYYNGHRYSPGSVDLATIADIGVGTIQNDFLTAPSTGQILDAGLGQDTVFVNSGHSLNTVTVQNSVATIVNSDAGNFTLQNAERIAFNDGVVAIDTEGNAGQVYRLYQASFARTPDLLGLSHNVKIVDQGLSLHDMAAAFTVSSEFQGRYGVNASDQTFISALYHNVLGREPDPTGNAGWLQLLGSQQYDRANVLIGFSESIEDKALVASAIQHGIALDYGVA
ncbi:DUF4214 domain-containing protein [Methylobacterium sp. WL12]|uniref:DUF4214 domain-containing protein n=1 Tax=Methylobacterium sp. WL12 TaxID=2603890 RepID=UPI0011C6F53A|nr:DUF4214 domain-containing protein [Methylobacterium sp. WL12]TXM64589.1 DUF4214 domain-containing protein [Methylobacterium sp. WL12]